MGTLGEQTRWMDAIDQAALVASGDVSPVLRTFLATFSDEKFVVPICAAMGFAYVLRHTGCERHLVLLLVKPTGLTGIKGYE